MHRRFRLGPTNETIINQCIEKIIKLLYTDPCAIDKIISSLESLKIFYGGATSENTLVKDAPAMLLGWFFASRDEVPMQRINGAIEAFRAIKASEKELPEKAIETLEKVVAVMRESRSVGNNAGFYLPGPMQISALEATQGSFNVLWLSRLCQAAGVPVSHARNELMLDCGRELLDALDALTKQPQLLNRWLATVMPETSSSRNVHTHE